MTDRERLGPPPIEPLSDAAWSRVERGVWERMNAADAAPASRAPARLWWLVASVVAAAAIVLIVIGIRPPAVAPAEVSRVVSGSSSSSVSFGDVHVELEPDTALTMANDEGHPTVALERGAAWFTVAPRAERPAFLVRAGDAAVRVVGTRFHVELSGERSAVEVEHGTVEVRFRGRVAQVGAKERWSSQSPAQATPAPAREDRPAASAARQPPEPAPAQPAPAQPAPPPPAHPAPTGTRPSAAVDEDRGVYERLAALEPAAPDEALAGYLALARRPGPWADPSLFAAGRLAADRHDPQAKELLRRYLWRFPAGANAADARKLLARIERDDH